jgi:hypothetical protein
MFSLKRRIPAVAVALAGLAIQVAPASAMMAPPTPKPTPTGPVKRISWEEWKKECRKNGGIPHRWGKRSFSCSYPKPKPHLQ